MSTIKARRNALADMESENVRQLHKSSTKADTNESSNPKAHEGAFHPRFGADAEHPASTYTSSELSEEIIVTTDDESSIVSHKEHRSTSDANAAATDYTRSFTANSDCCPTPLPYEKQSPLPMARRDNELNNNGLSNCNLLVNIPERDIRATIEQWREMATLAAISYGSAGVDPEKLLMSVPTTMSLHQPPSSFTRYDKNRIL